MQILANDRNLPSSFGFNATNRTALRSAESGVSHMKSNFLISMSRTSSLRTSFLRTSWMRVLPLMLALPIPALAALGGIGRSVQQDQAQMKSTLKASEAETYA